MVVGQFGDEIGGVGYDDDCIGIVGEIDVWYVVVYVCILLVGVDWVVGQGLYGDGGYEVCSCFGYYYMYCGIGVVQFVCQYGGFVVGYVVGQVQYDFFVSQIYCLFLECGVLQVCLDLWMCGFVLFFGDVVQFVYDE